LVVCCVLLLQKAVPPFYSYPCTTQNVLLVLKDICGAAPSLPCMYYHIPAATGCALPLYPVFAAAASTVPTLAGVKYVENRPDDFFALQRDFGSQYNFMWAVEPKVMGLGLGMQSSVVSESYFCPSWNRLFAAWLANDRAAVAAEQEWKVRASAIIGSFTGCTANKAVLKMLGADIGLQCRFPPAHLSQADYDSLYQQLHDFGFFNQTIRNESHTRTRTANTTAARALIIPDFLPRLLCAAALPKAEERWSVDTESLAEL
jgi:N-acetylneuraminate lyase